MLYISSQTDVRHRDRARMLSTSLSYQIYANNLDNSLKQVASQGDVQRDQKYYQANIGNVKSASDFVDNFRLFSYAMKASGLEDMTYAKAFMKKVLTSDLSDPKSFVNTLTDSRFKAFAQNYSFASGGANANAATAQTTSQENSTVAAFMAKAGSSTLNAVSATQYYEQHIGSVKSFSGLMADQGLWSYVMTAYGLDSSSISSGTLASSTASQKALESVLESDASDPGSTANQMAAGQVSTSALPRFAQSGAAVDTISSLYTKAFTRTTDLIYYEKTIKGVRSLNAFVSDPKLVDVAQKAYGIGPYGTDTLKAILTSDVDNPMSVARLLGPSVTAFAKSFNFTKSSGTDPLVQMAQDFNFDASGNVTTQRQVQTKAAITATATLYTNQAPNDRASKAKALTETAYYGKAMLAVTSIDDLLKDSRLVDFVKSAYQIDPKTSNATLRQVLTSDLNDPKSVASKLGPAYRRLSAAFNFTTSGTVARNAPGSPQTAKNTSVMSDGFLRQTLEDNAGQQNQGVKLALYFQRKASTITSAYSILADPALLKVVQTALNIPSAASRQNVDIQASQISNKLNIKDLQNPAKLKQFISRFTALYDLDNASNPNGGGGSSGTGSPFG